MPPKRGLAWLAACMVQDLRPTSGFVFFPSPPQVATTGRRRRHPMMQQQQQQDESADADNGKRAAPSRRGKHKIEAIQGESICGLPAGASPLWAYELSGSEWGIPLAKDWDLIVDVRSPSEFAEDHVPGAINVPVLSDAERVQVGTLYAENPFEARKLGAGLVSSNLGRALAAGSDLSRLGRDARVLVYCWRGGERSNAAAHVFSRIGWHAARLVGGYKKYRNAVQDALYSGDAVRGLTFGLIDGPTGSGKGLVLEALRRKGARVLDLEEAARHRGSALGSVFSSSSSSSDDDDDLALEVAPQPSQKAFETYLYAQLLEARRDSSSPLVFVEAESAKIGRLQIPHAAHRAFVASFAFTLEVPLPHRVSHLRQGYAVFEQSPAGAADLKRRLEFLAPRSGRDALARWTRLVNAKQWDDLVADLLVTHYDAAYAAASKRDRRTFASSSQLVVHLPDLQPPAVQRAADDILASCSNNAPLLQSSKQPPVPHRRGGDSVLTAPREDCVSTTSVAPSVSL